MGHRIERYFWDEKQVLLDIENKAQQRNERLFLYHQILMSAPNYFSFDQKQNFVAKKQITLKSTIVFILEGFM